MHPKASRTNKSVRYTGDLSSKELLQKIKRFNSLVKHYFFGHHTVAFDLCPDTARVLAPDSYALGDWPRLWVDQYSVKGACCIRIGYEKKLREPIEQL